MIYKNFYFNTSRNLIIIDFFNFNYIINFNRKISFFFLYSNIRRKINILDKSKKEIKYNFSV